MSEARYDIIRESSGWIIRHDRETSEPYELPEAAFEAAVAAASLSVRNRHDVIVSLVHEQAAGAQRVGGEAVSDPGIHG